MTFFRRIFPSLLLCLLIASCASRKKVVYLQNIDSANLGDSARFEPTLQPDDLLSIIVSAETPEVTTPFNLPQIQGNYEIGNNQNGIKTYLVDNQGYIDFPVLGKVRLGGLTRSEANAKLVKDISEYITNPSINLRILNYKVSVIGEVNKPGTFTLDSERLTLLEALSMAGDLTIYGKRDNILVIRESDGKKSFNRIDITKADFLSSEFYYLAQNDVVVIEPNQTKVNSSVVGPNITVTVSVLSLLVTIGIIIFR
jgi:polysaccharide export outer membrane protein